MAPRPPAGLRSPAPWVVAALLLGALAAGAWAWRYLAPGASAAWGSGFVLLLTTLPALLAGLVGVARAGARARRGAPGGSAWLALGALAVALGLVGVGAMAGVLPREPARPLGLDVLARGAVQGTLDLRDAQGREVAAFAFDVAAGEQRSFATQPLAAGPYDLSVALADGTTRKRIVGAGAGMGRVAVEVGPGSIRVGQVHGD